MALISGTTGNDTLEGGRGPDTLAGGKGNDLYLIDEFFDSVSENPNEGIDKVRAFLSHTLSDNVENLELAIGAGRISGTGNNLLNNIKGNEQNNVLTGLGGKDTLDGGLGNDTYNVNLVVSGSGANRIVKLEDVLIENSNTETDKIVLVGEFNDLAKPTTLTIPVNFETLDAYTFTGNTWLNITGNAADNFILGSRSNSIIDGGKGADRMDGNGGDDTYIVDNAGDVVVDYADMGNDTIKLKFTPTGTYTVAQHVENLVVLGSTAVNAQGNELDNTLTGNSGKDTLAGLDGNDTLNGGAGADSLIGGKGWDSYIVDNAGDSIVENINEGFDKVYASASHILGANVEDLLLTGTHAINGTGNALANVLTGNTANNRLNGLNGEDLLFGGAGNDILDGGSDNDTLLGGTGNDTLDGGADIDAMAGDTGNDVYYVDDVFDFVIETANGGIDTVRSYVDHVLGASVENLELLGIGDLDGTGNNLANSIKGNDGANWLRGEGGKDSLAGGKGDDGYRVNLIASGSGDTKTAKLEDVVIENANAGRDTLVLVSAVADLVNATTLTLAANFETFDATGTGLTKLNLTGNAINNTIVGNDVNNVIDGGGGADRLYGLRGDDTYVLDNAGDVAFESGGQGTDTVKLKFAPVGPYTLGANIENLVVSVGTKVNAQGNADKNSLTGNIGKDTLSGLDGDDTLNGGAGADVLIGGLGNDRYIIDNMGDSIIENAGEGNDTVSTSFSYTLGANLEHVALTGSKAISATGNELINQLEGNAASNKLFGLGGADRLYGNAGNDTLDGGGGNDYLDGGAGNDLLIGGEGDDQIESYIGNDTMIGGQGNDIYRVESAGDIVIEHAGEGTDTVDLYFSPIGTYVLGEGIENLAIRTFGNIDAAGNGLDNIILGNGERNALSGEEGNDTLLGGYGNDLLIGGAGADVFWFRADPGVDNVDVIDDFASGTDQIQLDYNVFQSLIGPPGDLPSAFLQIGSAAGDANDYIIYNNATGELFYDPDGSSAQQQMLFAQLDPGLALTGADFNIVG